MTKLFYLFRSSALGKCQWISIVVMVYNIARVDILVLRLQTIKAIVDSRRFKSPKSEEPRRVQVQVLDLYCLTRFESEGSSKGIVY